MQLRVIHTTDNQFIGKVFATDLLDLTGDDMYICDDVVLSITDYVDLGGGDHQYSNSNYVVTCEEVLDGS